MSVAELACTYAALILHDDNIPITAEAMEKLTKAAGVEVEPYWFGLFTKMLESRDITEMLTAASSGAAAPAAAGGEAVVEEEKEEEKKEEEEEESDDDMGFGLFD